MWKLSLHKTPAQNPQCFKGKKAFGLEPHKLNFVSKRYLHLHEYQSQDLMRKFKISVPVGEAVSTPEEAYNAAKKMGGAVVVKAQILAGGRGLGTFNSGLKGGVHLCKTPEQAKDYATKMLGHILVTKQTGAQGNLVQKILVAKQYQIKRELYVAFLLDRGYQGLVLVASKQGGVNIEDVAAKDPSAIVKKAIDLDKGPSDKDLLEVAEALGFSGAQKQLVSSEISKIYQLFKKKDATMIEINPFVETQDGNVMCLDAKLNFDDNSKFRQYDVFEMEDHDQKNPKEVEAEKFDLNYISLDGNIGCLVNGAGLAMATMDLIKLNGGTPANFLDVGGGASQQQVIEAIRIINGDPNVKAILVNIFGGIMRCEIIANGIVEAMKRFSLRIPLVVRLKGTNVELAKMILEESGLKITSCDDLDLAAKTVVEASKSH